MPATLVVRGEPMGRVGNARAVEVGQARLHAVRPRKPAEEVVEGAVLHHEEHDVLDARQSRRRQHGRLGQPGPDAPEAAEGEGAGGRGGSLKEPATGELSW